MAVFVNGLAFYTLTRTLPNNAPSRGFPAIFQTVSEGVFCELRVDGVLGSSRVAGRPFRVAQN
jgi:hypothetical protein